MCLHGCTVYILSGICPQAEFGGCMVHHREHVNAARSTASTVWTPLQKMHPSIAAATTHGTLNLPVALSMPPAVECGAPAMEVMKMSLKSAGVRFGVPSGRHGSLPPPAVCSCAQAVE